MHNHGKPGVIQIWIKRKVNVADRDRQLREVLNDYAKFLQDKGLTLD